jgi:hypothetical protein
MPVTIGNGWSIGPGWSVGILPVGSITVCGTANENGTVAMTAPPDTVFTSVEFASYGTPNGTCGAFSLGACHAANSVSIVSGYLIGNSGTVNIPATNVVFGDPCGGIGKRLYVQATAVGRAAGLFKTTYSGYFNDVPDFFATATPASVGGNPTTSVQTTAIEEPATDDGSNFSVQWLGYFLASTTETYTFFTSSDDASYVWVGDTALSGFTTANPVVNNGGAHAVQERSGTISLTAGVFYPIRIQFGEASGGDAMTFAYSTPTITKTTNVTGRVFYNPATNGF